MKILFIILTLLFLPTVGFCTNYGNDANCMGYWAMEEGFSAGTDNETDLSGEGGTLVETSGDIPNSADKMFGSYSRDFELGDSEYLTHADGGSTDISGADQAISFICFYKSENADQTNEEVLIGKYDNVNSDIQYTLYIATTGDVATLRLSSDGASTSSAVGATDIGTNWRGIAAVYNDTDIRIYLDGSLDSNGSSNPRVYSGGIFNANEPFYIGVHLKAGNLDEYADGLIDDAAVFNRALTSVEVADINTNGVQGSAPPATVGKVIMISG